MFPAKLNKGLNQEILLHDWAIVLVLHFLILSLSFAMGVNGENFRAIIDLELSWLSYPLLLMIMLCSDCLLHKNCPDCPIHYYVRLCCALIGWYTRIDLIVLFIIMYGYAVLWLAGTWQLLWLSYPLLCAVMMCSHWLVHERYTTHSCQKYILCIQLSITFL